jgi:hypothetical protein
VVPGFAPYQTCSSSHCGHLYSAKFRFTDLYSADRRLNGQEEALVATTYWTFVRPLRAMNGLLITNDVRRAIGHC